MSSSTPVPAGIGWLGIIRLGTVQAAIGAMVMLATSLLNRVMVVEYAIAAAVPAAPAAAVAVAVAGFDPDKAPVATPKLGAWPYFSLIDGYVAMTRENAPGDSAKDLLRDVAFDEYQLFDGTRLLRVEGRLKTARATGK